eukprot:11811-Heterococcus_DN1.PRE.1
MPITATREPLWRQIARVLQEGWEVNIALLAASAVLITILILRTTFTSAVVQADPGPYIFYVSASGQTHYTALRSIIWCTNDHTNTSAFDTVSRVQFLQWAYAVAHVVLPIFYICLAQYTHSSDTVREATVTLGAFDADEINATGASINGSCDNLTGLNTDVENLPSHIRNKHKGVHQSKN